MDSTVAKWLRNEGVADQPGIDLYLFGSLLTSETPQDVDLVIVYDAAQIDIDKAIVLRRQLRNAIHELWRIPADILLLSTGEMEQTQFLNRIDAVHLEQASL